MERHTVASVRWMTFCVIICVHVHIIVSHHPSAFRYNGNCTVTSLVLGEINAMNCCNLNLLSVPADLPDSLTSLLICNNSIQNTSYAFTNLHNLATLHLSRNRISRLELSSFQGLRNLKHLVLLGNRLLMNLNTTYSEDAFDCVPELETLDLSSNQHPPQGSTYPDKALSRLSNLKELKIDGINYGIFGKGFRNMRKLTRLHMSENDGHCCCSIEHLTGEMFRNIVRLKMLELIGCSIQAMEQDTFSELNYLEKLDLSGNRHMGFDVFENGSRSLPSTKITELRLNNIHRGRAYTLESHHLQHLTRTNLEAIFIESNLIVDFDERAMLKLPRTLKKCSVRGNLLWGVDFLAALHNFTHLEFLDISFQRIPDNAFPKTSTLENSEIFSNEPQNKSATTGVAESGFITSTVGVLTKGCATVPFPSNLAVFLASNMNFKGVEIPCLAFIQQPNNLSILNVSADLLCPWIGPLLNLNSLRHFDLSENACNNVSGMFFSHLVNVETLLLRENRLGISMHKSPDLFSNLTKLKHLDLSENGLKSLPQRVFSKLENVRTLELQNNALMDIDLDIWSSTRLEFIDLSDNLLSDISANMRHQLDEISQNNPNFRLNMEGNHLKCNCEYIDFASWLGSTDVNFNSFGTSYCEYVNKSKITVKSLTIHQLRVFCAFSYIVWGAVVALLVLIIFTAVPMSIYHNKWKIRYLYYSLGNEINPYELTGSAESDESTPLTQSQLTDAYLSFDDQSRQIRDLVLGDLVTRLNSKMLSTFTRETCIRPGTHSEMVEITRAINRSRKTVVFCSARYFAGFHNKYEFNCSILRGIKVRRSTLIIVNVDGVGFHKNDIQDDSILTYLKSHRNRIFHYNNNDLDGLVNFLERRLTP